MAAAREEGVEAGGGRRGGGAAAATAQAGSATLEHPHWRPAGWFSRPAGPSQEAGRRSWAGVRTACPSGEAAALLMKLDPLRLEIGRGPGGALPGSSHPCSL